MKSWKDYQKTGQAGSWSQRVTGSGHITVSAILQQDGTLKAFPPRAAQNAFPVFMTLDATAGGKITESFAGVYTEKGWKRSCEMECARAELWWIFLGHYRKVREKEAATKAAEDRFFEFASGKLENPDGQLEVTEDDEVFLRPYCWTCLDIIIRLVGEESTEFANGAVGTLQTLRSIGWLTLVEIPQPETPKFLVANFVGNEDNAGGRVVYREVSAQEIVEWIK